MRRLLVDAMRGLLAAGTGPDAGFGLGTARALGRAAGSRRAGGGPRCQPSRGLAAQPAAADAAAEGKGWAENGLPADLARKYEQALRDADLGLAGRVGPHVAELAGQTEPDEQASPPGSDDEQESWQDVAARRRQDGDAPRAAPARRARAQGSLAGGGTRIYEDDEHSIRGVHIPRSAWTVLLALRGAGHEAYIVGGAIRDMLLKGVPKDFDILTSATGRQVQRLLRRSRLIGKRFPIVQVTIDGSLLEVSSFATGVALSDLPYDAAALLGSKKAQLGNLESKQGQELLWKAARQQNAWARDFTVNALMYDPFSRVIFDYTGGVADCRRQVLRTIVEPQVSFEQDPARILRAIRLAARAGLKIDDATAAAIEDCRESLCELPTGRGLMEAQALLGVGAATASMQLLWRHGLMELLFPAVARYLTQQKVSRNLRKPHKEPLFRCLARMDAKASVDRQVPAALWLAVIASPLVQQQALKQGLRASSLAEDAEDGADTDEEDSATDAEEEEGAAAPVGAAAGAEYRRVAKGVVDALMDNVSVPIAPKAVRQQVLKMLESAEAYRRNGQQVRVPCRDCSARTNVKVPQPLKMAKLKATCSACGAEIPSKLVKKRLPPEARLLVEIVQPAT